MIYLCDWRDCSFLTRWKGELEVHRRRHAGVRTVKCGDCEKSFFCQRDLTIHARTHKGIKPYHCQSCNLNFTQKGQLNAHVTRYHMSNKKLHPCSACGKILLTADGLRIHWSSHTGYKPHCCSKCGRRFVSRANLRQHAKVHEGGSFQCPDCRKTFNRRQQLREHMMSSPLFQCGNCHRSFKRRQQLEAHTNTHTGQKPHACPALNCNEAFASASRLSHHRKKCRILLSQQQSVSSSFEEVEVVVSLGDDLPLFDDLPLANWD